MKFELVELIDFSGPKATIYSVYLEDEDLTLFDKFLIENEKKFKSEVISILDKIDRIVYKFGAERIFFKENEGRLGDLVCALYDSPDSNLRLYCIRLGKNIIILGGGGEKPKSIRTLQENEKLTKENNLLRKFSEIFYKKMLEKEIYWENELTLGGNFNLDTDE